MKFIVMMLLSGALLNASAQAQFTGASLQASGLTCSMCSKAVLKALQKVSFVDKVDVDLKTQEYNLQFKPATTVNFDALSAAVEDAGFSVASLKVMATVTGTVAENDKHIKIGDNYFHFLNGANQPLSGNTSFLLVDKHFTSAKTFKKWEASSKMPCVSTGHAGTCCPGDAAADARVYHAVI